MANLLIVDDELGMRQFLTHLLQREGHTVRVAENGQQALKLLREQAPDLIVSDIRMPDMNGVDLLRAARELLPAVEVIMMTAFANVDTAREAFLLGRYAFVQKPVDNDLLKETVARALQKISLVKEKEALLEENKALIQGQRTRGQLGNIIGRSARMLALYQMIERVAQVQATVLVTGESGTGKELVARAIHDLSPRAEKPFVSVNCGAFTETLLESELFGYMKGSFTGATANRKGLLEAANQGTIVPAATNRDLAALVKDGIFREDLFYRVSVIPMELPPLRERAGDIVELTDYFMAKHCTQAGRSLAISPQAMRRLETYSWPGNVRELEHTIERAVALETTDTIQPERLPEQITNYNQVRVASAFDLPDGGLNLTAHLDQLEKTYLLEALRRTDGNQTNAAELLQMSVRSLRHLLDKHGVRGLTAQMRDERRGTDSIPRRRSTDPQPRRRADDVAETSDDNEQAASAGER